MNRLTRSRRRGPPQARSDLGEVRLGRGPAHAGGPAQADLACGYGLNDSRQDLVNGTTVINFQSLAAGDFESA